MVIHETGNTAEGSDAAGHSAYLLSGKSGDTSWHYTVDDHQIYHHIPDDEIAWHAGDRRTRDGGNLCGIGVELCVNEDGDFEKTFNNAARLTAYLLDTYGLQLGDVKQHADFMDQKFKPSGTTTGGRNFLKRSTNTKPHFPPRNKFPTQVRPSIAVSAGFLLQPS